MKGRILQSHTSIPLKCRTSCLFIKLKLGRVGMGGVGFGPSCPAPTQALEQGRLGSCAHAGYHQYYNGVGSV